MNAKHTPKPWRVADITPDDHAAAVITNFPEGHDDPLYLVAVYGQQSAADARLIAAAPETAAERDRLKQINAELLAALEECITDAAATCHRNAKYQRMRSEYINQVARAAIAKARGE